MKSLVEYAKKNKVSYGSAGQGSLTHLAMEQFRTAAGFEAVHAAYRGIGPAITDVLGGQTQMMMPGLAAALPHIKAGKMQADRRHGPEAPPAAARHADLRGARVQGLRRRAVVRDRGSREDAARGREAR